MKNRERFWIFLVLALFLIVALSSGIPQADEEIEEPITKPRPEINVTFPYEVNANEVTIINYSLIWVINEQSTPPLVEVVELEENYTLEDNQFRYRPATDLMHLGSYLFAVNFTDRAGNYDTKTISFVVVYPQLEITLDQPENGASREDTFDVVIKTDRKAHCKYNVNRGSSIGYYSTASDEFDEINEDINDTFTINDFETQGVEEMYVFCKDDARLGEIVEKEFVLYHDTARPNIMELYTDYENNIITDDFDPLKTNLYVRTDEETICKYGVVYGNTVPQFEAMQEFPGFDEKNFGFNHQEEIFPAFVDPDEPVTYAVLCQDRAYWLSAENLQDADTIDIGLDLTGLLEFKSVDTPRYISTSSTKLRVTMNKRNAGCLAYPNQDLTGNPLVMENKASLQYNATSPSRSPGTHSFWIKCFHSTLDDQDPDYIVRQITYTIDNEEPEMIKAELISPLGNGSEYTYHDNKLKVRFEAEDNESGVQSFRYSVINHSSSTDRIIETGSVSPNERDEDLYVYDDDITGLDLEDGSEYYLEVNATDMVEQTSTSKLTNHLTVDRDRMPVSCNNDRIDGQETDEDCGGNCPRKCGLNQNCSVNQDCISNNCDEDGLCKASSCRDGEWNGQETDEDCGGNCPDCDINKNCDKNSDCASKYCSPTTKKCAQRTEPCFNQQLDPGETDEDCGGVCDAKCDTDQSCDNDDDCKNKICGTDGKCKAAKCDDGKQNGDESDKDCGSVCPNKCGLDKKCYSDFDCVTDTCGDQGVCIPDPDRDKDGMDNDWEERYGLNPDDASDANEDLDNDGFTNLQEFENRTDPTDPKSPGKPRSKIWIYLLLILIFIAAGVVGYLLYLRYQQMDKKPPKPIPRMPGVAIRRPMGRPIPPIRRQMPIRRMPITKPIEKAKEWLSLGELRKPKKPASDVFDRLSNIAKKGPREKKDVFADLGKIAGQEITRSHIQTISKSKQTPKDDLLKTFHKIAEKKINESVIKEINKTLSDLERSHKHLRKEISKVNKKIEPLRKIAKGKKKAVKTKKVRKK